jgi:type IV pilus modification protein PilV
MTKPVPRCNGFSLLEAMAALMVLNMLCLGLMAWQLQAMQAQRDALSMQQAVAMAQDLWQRMQVHPAAAPYYQLDLDSVPTAMDCQSQACNAAQWAQSDIADWWLELRQRLPQARASLTTNQGTSDVQLMLVWPSSSTTPVPEASDMCPLAHRCWQTTWRL